MSHPPPPPVPPGRPDRDPGRVHPESPERVRSEERRIAEVSDLLDEIRASLEGAGLSAARSLLALAEARAHCLGLAVALGHPDIRYRPGSAFQSTGIFLGGLAGEIIADWVKLEIDSRS
jgi:hypothetical protein